MRWQVEQRMNFIAETIRDVGHINRVVLCEKFGISVPQASVDLKTYMRILPNEIFYNTNKKRYEAVIKSKSLTKL